jgi:hypothetical protein
LGEIDRRCLLARLVASKQKYTVYLTIELDEEEILALYKLINEHSRVNDIELDSLWEIIRVYGDKQDIPF